MLKSSYVIQLLYKYFLYKICPLENQDDGDHLDIFHLGVVYKQWMLSQEL
jgi:hypothetical protein